MALPLRAILFDLDGTLLDTAPDMVGALNTLLQEQGLAPLPYDEVRGAVSHGAARVVKSGFPDASPERCADLQRRFLEIYRGALSRGTRLFPGMVANYGYVLAGEDSAAWRADGYLQQALDLLGWLDASGRA